HQLINLDAVFNQSPVDEGGADVRQLQRQHPGGAGLDRYAGQVLHDCSSAFGVAAVHQQPQLTVVEQSIDLIADGDTALMQDGDVRADPFQVGQLRTGQEEGGALVTVELADQRQHVIDPAGVQAVERLVQYHQPGIADQPLGDRGPAPVAQ